MTALNPPRFLPGEADVVLRLLMKAKGGRLERDEIDRLVFPAGLFQGSSQDRPDRETLTVLRSTGLVVTDGDSVVIGAPLQPLANRAGAADGDLRRAIRGHLLRSVPVAEAAESTEEARDLGRAAAWFLLQDIWTPMSGWRGAWEAVQERQLKFDDRVLLNDTRWGSFERWMPYLGLGVHDRSPGGTGQVLVPDPTVAVREELAVFAKPGVDRPLSEVVAELANRCPVLDGGVYSRVIRERLLATPTGSEPGALSSSLSHALRRLRDAGELELLDRGDAAKTLLRTPEGTVPFSHLLWKPPS